MRKLTKNLFLLLATLPVLMVSPGFSEEQSATKHVGDLRIPDKLSQGDMAPDFRLQTKDGKQEIALSSFRGKKPVVLIFGSYT